MDMNTHNKIKYASLKLYYGHKLSLTGSTLHSILALINYGFGGSNFAPLEKP
jgi:hypothetical protein